MFDLKLFLNKLWGVILISTLFFINCTPSKRFLLKHGKSISSDSNVRILIYKGTRSFNISSTKGLKVSYLKNRKIIYKGINKKISFEPNKISEPIIVESWNDIISFNNIKYRGSIEIHRLVNKIYVVNIVSIKKYLSSVVPSEMSPSWPMEALKAQAVAARTYAYHHLMTKKINNIYDLDSTTSFQVYKGLVKESAATNKAVEETANEIMIYNNKPIVAFFHSTCGGYTVNNEYVWTREKIDYLRGVKCNFCKESPHYNWTEKISLYELKKKLQARYGNIGNITGITLRKFQGRVFYVNIIHTKGRLKLTGNEFRIIVSAKKIKSLYLNAKKIENGLILDGHGWGHGVGMCQYGARGMSLKGISYKTILKYYFKGISIVKLRL